ncbi:MAG: guanylate kinase [Pseudomonadales bacterium]
MSSRKTGKLVVIAAPSGAGKTSLVKALIERNPDIDVAVSHTTRQKRPFETDGVNYHFVDVATFQTMIKNQEFVEHAEVFGNFYGTSRAAMDEIINQGTHVILEIDYQGAAQIRAQAPEAITIFILPPSRAALKERLQNRAQDDAATIARRTQEAVNEISHCHEFDYLVVNDSFEVALEQIHTIITQGAPELRQAEQQQALSELLKELLSSTT